MSEALQSFKISRTRNALLPSVSSWLHCSGNNEVQLENLKASNSMQMDNLFHFQSNGFNLECSRIFNNNSQFRNGGNTKPSQSQSSFDQYDADDYNHQTGCLYGVPSREGISQQALFLKTPSMSQNEGLKTARKRPFEAIDNMELLKKMKNNPKSEITILEPNWHQSKKSSEAIQGHQLLVPERRKQKLSDKITTLQKLASPYGKTDTASVLHEASLYIKLLQEQIENLFRMLSLSYNNAILLGTQEGGEEVVDLRSKGLCLVPIPITHKSNNGRPDSSWTCPKENNPAHEFLMHIDYNL